MSVVLTKGGNVSLTKVAPSMVKTILGLGWDARATSGAEFDLDASAFLLKADGKVRTDSDFIFYNNLVSVDQSVTHLGDNRTGAGDGDDEQVKVDLSKVPANIDRIAITVTIHDAVARGQNFGMVRNAYIHLVDEVTGVEVTRYDLSEDASTNTAMVFGELYRHGEEWKFRAIGQGFDGGLGPLARNYGVDVA